MFDFTLLHVVGWRLLQLLVYKTSTSLEVTSRNEQQAREPKQSPDQASGELAPLIQDTARNARNAVAPTFTNEPLHTLLLEGATPKHTSPVVVASTSSSYHQGVRNWDHSFHF